MSLITSCPACGTMFRVVPDQLKISEGWVRCGHCGKVFDAAASLAEQPSSPPSAVPGPAPQFVEPDPAPTVPPVAPPGAVTRPAQEVDAASTPSEAPGAVVPIAPSEPVPLAAAVAGPAALEPASTEEAEAVRPPPYLPAVGNPGHRAVGDSTDSELLEESPHDVPFIFRRSDLVHDEEDQPDEPPAPPPASSRARTERAPREADAVDTEAPDSGLEEVSFVRQARRRAFWRRPAVRLALGFLGMLLAGLLALQVAYQERNRLAVAVPELAPALERMCEMAACRLGPPRQIESVVIESSTFSKLRNDTYRLSFTLRSTASLAVAVPSMELTLTDGQDQPVLRRVLTPAEFGARAPVLTPGADLALTVGVVVSAPANARVAGYRLLAFYP